MTIADPTIIQHKGLYYAYGTSGLNDNKGIPVYTSKNMFFWKEADHLAVETGKSFGTKGFWAPQVFEYKNKWYMAYTANEEIAIASSNSPAGPFIQPELKALVADKREIDPFVFFDEGKIYLYHVRLDSGNRIFVAQLNDNLSAFIPGTLQPCLKAEDGWEDTENAPWPVSEGPTVIKRNKKYYMFYSANDFRNIDYAVGVAVSDNPVGPWQKLPTNPFFSRATLGFNGTGHGDVLRTKDGKWWYILHTHNTPVKVGPRKTAIVEFEWKGDTPQVLPKTFQWLTR